MADAAGKTKKSSRAVLRAVLIVLISLVVGLNVYQWNASRLVGNALPMPFGFGVAIVLSGSMEPALSVNDLVIVTEAEDYSVGDVVVFQDAGDLIIHRIIAKDAEAELFQTKGDANNTADEPIRLDQVKGKESFHIPLVGIIVRALKTPVGIIAVLVLAAFLMHRSWKSEKAQGDEKLDAIKEEIRRLKAEQEAAEAAPPEKTLPVPDDDPIDIPL